MATKKSFSLFDKLLYFVNSLCAAILLFAYFLPYISPKTVPLFSVLSLAVPLLIIINVGFFVYWLIRLKKYLILSGVVLGIGLVFSSPFFKISGKKTFLNDDVKVMSYNVRMFNFYKWIEDEAVDEKIVEFINQKDPDILAIQEYHHSDKRNLQYPYSYFVPKSKHKNFGLAIFSKFPIINKGSLDFKESANNAIFIDIKKGKDTVRVYNVHLQSLKINPTKENFGQENSEKLIERLEIGFQKQATQTEQFLAHEKQWKGKKIVCGDFNNTAYSWVYRQISKGKKDAFAQAGSGLGKSFNYVFPMRIDFILTDPSSEINNYQTFKHKYSDHFPIMARVNW
ncbi:endonuclease/exonuclease/phosphatase family protein [Tenacibaculum sp. IB213877]|uniref:endonuclease/exonuclease/phosphatase family protein n=1 Tax=Tenacibaculum sp. IB213877 TaxID=3097351 RepID=UPI002A5AA2FC|nr:endonuclease/exonuclease/phosphatase family protein [Tenacibaculum sp. IB213877]MDY0779870.1 endonuclease/exonuclease/phosphatase family protein [Tenacibaculum sp. IB213877]